MFHLAPVGLPPPKSGLGRVDALKVERNVLAAIGNIASEGQKSAFNQMHPDTHTLLKALDDFFSHGLINGERCYWCFVREYIPSTDQDELRRQWNTQRLRALSIAWLKDSLNRANLHFQMLAFIPDTSYNRGVKGRWYSKRACLRNTAVLKRVCMATERLSLIDFNIESPYVLCAEETPIALAANDFPPLHILAQMDSLDVSAQREDDLSPAEEPPVASAFATSSYSTTGLEPPDEDLSCPLAGGNSSLQVLVSDLPEVRIPPSAHEPGAGNQDSMLEELLKAHKLTMSGLLPEDTEEDDSLVGDAAERPLPGDAKPPASEPSTQEDAEEEKEALDDFRQQLGKQLEDRLAATTIGGSLADELLLSGEDGGPLLRGMPWPPSKAEGSSSSATAAPLNLTNSSARGEELSEDDALLEDAASIAGEERLDSGEIIQLASEVFRESGEKFHKMYRVFIGHCAGQPLLRYLLITNRYIYLISAEPVAVPVPTGDVRTRGGLVGSFVGSALEAGMMRVGSWSLDFASTPAANPTVGSPSLQGPFSPSSLRSRGSLCSGGRGAIKYVAHLTMELSEIDCITVGVDSQVLCFHLKKRRRQLPADGGGKFDRYEKKTHVVETGSHRLGRAITHYIKRLMLDVNTMLSVEDVPSPRKQQPGQAQPGGGVACTTIFTHSTHLSIIMKRFARKELGLPYTEIVHHSLVYWLERVDRGLREPGSTPELESYLHLREVTAGTWLAPQRLGDWQMGYFILRGSMLYHFSDSTCKFAIRSLNVRERVERVSELDASSAAHLGNPPPSDGSSPYEGKYAFEVVLTTATSTQGPEGAGEVALPSSEPLSLHFGCPDRATMRTWINRMSQALFTVEGSPSPVACMMIVTDADVLFAQEGANCIVDGFMRSLAPPLSVKHIASVYALRAENRHTLVVRRENGAMEWVALRDEAELNRLIATFTEKWRIPVEDCLDEENFSKPEFNRLFEQDADIPDMWGSVSTGDDS